MGQSLIHLRHKLKKTCFYKDFQIGLGLVWWRIPLHRDHGLFCEVSLNSKKTSNGNIIRNLFWSHNLTFSQKFNTYGNTGTID